MAGRADHAQDDQRPGIDVDVDVDVDGQVYRSQMVQRQFCALSRAIRSAQVKSPRWRRDAGGSFVILTQNRQGSRAALDLLQRPASGPPPSRTTGPVDQVAGTSGLGSSIAVTFRSPLDAFESDEAAGPPQGSATVQDLRYWA